MLRTLGISDKIFPEVVMPGTQLGSLLPYIAEDVGLDPLPVVAVATHDTASAAAAVPAADDDFVWISSGTWSLLGGVAKEPIVTPEALQYNFSSYGGAGGGCLPWKNIMGLWLVQECRRIWAKGGEEFSYDEITQMAVDAQPFAAVIDPDHAMFLAPDDMPAAICTFCQETGQTIPQTKGEIVRTALEGLALKYRWTIEKLGVMLEKNFNALHIVGGGSKNRLLCQFAADVTRLPVVAGPVEATAIGNIAVQAVATGHLSSLDEARRVIRNSFEVEIFESRNSEMWDDAYNKFWELLN
jgi:rhamnulokinase